MALQDPSGLAGATRRMATPAGVGARSTVASGATGLGVLEPDTEHLGPYAATTQAEPSVQLSAAYNAAQAQPIGNWGHARDRTGGWGRHCWCLGR